jgi:hypothetical protein
MEQHSMPLDPQRVQAIFLEAASYHDRTDRATILDRECVGDSELRLRIDALLKAHDRFNDGGNTGLATASCPPSK